MSTIVSYRCTWCQAPAVLRVYIAPLPPSPIEHNGDPPALELSAYRDLCEAHAQHFRQITMASEAPQIWRG